MKKTLSIVLAVLLCLTLLAGCGGRESAKTAVTNGMNALITLDEEGMTKYFGNDASFSTAFEGQGDSTREMVTQIMGGMTFSIGEVKEDGDTATATVTLTNKDMSVVMNAFMTNLIGDVMAGNVTEADMTDEKYMQYFADALTACTDTTSNEVTLPMSYTKDAGWTITADAALADAMTGGFLTALSSMSASFGG